MGLNFKVIKSGNIIEIYEYERIRLSKNDVEREKTVKCIFDDIYETAEDKRTKEEIRKNNNHRARENLRRLVNANFKKGCYFVTLTYKDNMQDIKQSNKCFKDYIKRLKYKYNAPSMKYIAVIEFQKRGAIHYHCLISLIDIPINDIRKTEYEMGLTIWKHGFVKIKNVEGWKNCDNVGAYLIKYMSKDIKDKRLEGHNRYLRSNNLISPEVITGDKALCIYNSLQGHNTVFTSEYYGNFWGSIKYSEYNLERGL